MEALSKKIAARIAMNLGKTEEEEKVIAYGLLGLIQLLIQAVLLLSVGYSFKILGPIIFLSLSISLLRAFSGGAHAKSINFCTLFSLFYAGLMAKIATILSLKPAFTLPAISTAFIIFPISLSIIHKKAPVASANKPISPKKSIRMHKYSIYILVFYSLLYTILVALGLKDNLYLKYAYSLKFGLIWQVFTLTDLGAKFVEGLNNIFHKQR
ncbi:MAG: accessory gene regulator B family protein [Firmicutes bacterium]|jgi:accessory gene regulator B|nr:accessory gene regulator B family protein [Bacillota bacterium]